MPGRLHLLATWLFLPGRLYMYLLATYLPYTKLDAGNQGSTFCHVACCTDYATAYTCKIFPSYLSVYNLIFSQILSTKIVYRMLLTIPSDKLEIMPGFCLKLLKVWISSLQKVSSWHMMANTYSGLSHLLYWNSH